MTCRSSKSSFDVRSVEAGSLIAQNVLARERAAAGIRIVHTILAGEAAGNFQPWGHPDNCRDPGNGIESGPDSFGRPHFPQVAGFVMCDGSVRFLSRNIDPKILKALATPAGKETVEIPGDAAPVAAPVGAKNGRNVFGRGGGRRNP
jgi:hypothetical protein